MRALGGAVALATLFACVNASADAVVVTRAMKATTILEAFVERDAVTLELEVGQEDRDVFASLIDSDHAVPFPLRPTAPIAVIADGMRLQGEVVERDTRTRVERDEISGEPLPSESQEEVFFLVLRYPLRTRPRTIRIEPPVNETGYVASDIGFVLTHEGVAINDFRYLAPEQVARLDWEDPFYSAFERRVLNRKHQSPLNVFLYIEPFEVRKELVVRPVDIARFADIDLAPHQIITPEDRGLLLERLAEFLKDRAPVTIDGVSREPILARIHFLERGLRMTQVVPPDQPIDTTSAIVGAIYVYPTKGLPNQVLLTWDLFDSRIPRVPASATDEAGPLPTFLTRDAPELEWRNFLKNVQIPNDLDVEPLATRIEVPVLSVLCGLAAIALAFFAATLRRPTLATAGGALLVVAWLARPYATLGVSLPPHVQTPKPADAAPTIHALLYNAYRALDFRDEEMVFDRLASSLSGEVLERVYLDMRRSLRLENQGGAQVRVREVALTNLDPERATEPGTLAYRVGWNVRGSVGHWGHTHLRTNHYDAAITLADVDGSWKISNLEILEERRVVEPPLGEPASPL